MGAWGRFLRIACVGFAVGACSQKKDPWVGWQPNPNPTVDVTENDVNPPIPSTIVEPAHRLLSWRGEKPQDLFEAIPATPPESAVTTSEGIVYSSSSATVFVPRNGKPRVLSSDSWKIVGKLPNEKVIVESGLKLFQLDVKSGQVSFTFDIRSVLKNANLSWETLEDSKGILLNINSKSSQASGIYRFDGSKLEPVFVEEGETYSPFSIKQAFPHKFALIENVNNGHVLLFDRSTLEVLEIPQTNSTATQGDVLVLPDQRILSLHFDLDKQYALIQARNSEGQWERLEPADEASRFTLPEFAVAFAEKTLIVHADFIGRLEFSEGKFKLHKILNLDENIVALPLVPLINQSDRFYMVQGDKLYLLASQTSDDSEQTQGRILEINLDGQVQFLPAEVDVMSLSVFIRSSSQEVLAVMDAADGNFEAFYRFQPGQVEEVLRPNRLMHNLINYGVQFVSRTSTNRWLMGSRHELIAFEAQTKSLKSVELSSAPDVYRRDWIGHANGIALSIDRETFDSTTHRIVAWHANHKKASPVAGWSFDLPPNFELAEARLESVEGENQFSKFHIWARFQEIQGSRQITQDAIVNFKEDVAELQVELLPSSTFEIGNLGSPYVRTKAGSFELTNDAILSGTPNGTFHRMSFVDILDSESIVDVASRAGQLVAVVVDKTRATTFLLRLTEEGWVRTKSTPWIHSDIWISEQGVIHWKVLDPTDYDVSKLMRMDSKMAEVREYPWDSGCSAEGYEVEGLGFVALQSPIQSPKTCFFRE